MFVPTLVVFVKPPLQSEIRQTITFSLFCICEITMPGTVQDIGGPVSFYYTTFTKCVTKGVVHVV